MNATRARISTVQSRLAQKQDPLRRKLIDGTNLYHISVPVDCIRMKIKKTFEGDDISWLIQKCDVVSAVFPPLNDVPYRKVNVDPETKAWSLTSLISAFEDDAQEKFYSLQIPFEFDIDVNDMLFRIMLDQAQNYPIIIPIQVTELLGTFGMLKIIMNKVKCVIPTEDFPPEVINTIHQMALRRQIIQY